MDFYSILEFIYVVVCVVLLFGAAIFVHEFGHFWVALKCGMKVEEFSIGFGHKIKSWKRNGIEYSIRWIPAGGFVRLPQMVTSEALEGVSQEPCPPAAPWKRILTAFAGPGMNVVFAFFLGCILFGVGLPYLINPPIVGHLDENSEEYQMGIRYDDKIISVDGHPVKSWEDVQMNCILALTNVVPFVTERNDQLFTNYLKLTVNEDVKEMLGSTWKLPNLEPKNLPIAQRVIAGGAAEKAGVKNGDHILAFNDVPIQGVQQLIDVISQCPGKESTIQIARTLENNTVTNMTLKITPADMGGVGKIAVNLSSPKAYAVQWPGPWPWESVGDAFQKNFISVVALCNPSKSGMGVKDLSGPPGILAMLATFVKDDYRLALNFMILLNVSLAILNLLPVPVLDGGHIVMSAFEWITGKAVNIRILEYVNTIFALLLIGFMIWVSINDIKRFSLFKDLYKQDAQFENAAPALDSPSTSDSVK